MKAMTGKTQGFSLIEMLVVMTIMGLIVSVVTLSTGLLTPSSGNRSESAEVLADQLMLLMSTASAEAILSGEPLALSFSRATTTSSATGEHGLAVSWLRYARSAGGALRNRQSRWQAVATDTGLRDLHVPAAISSDLSIEGEMIDPQALAGNPGVPALVFYPTGETTAFSWSLADDDQAVVVGNANSGQIERKQP